MEFGSDFNFIDNYPAGKGISEYIRDYSLYACGRQALEDVLLANGIKKIFVPSYFCIESLERLTQRNIDVAYYHCLPTSTEDEISAIVKTLDIAPTDALLRMNFYGLQSAPGYTEHDYYLIEDHSHSLISEWALSSKADWCIASLRKTLPIADGGILWSPIGRKLPEKPSNTTKSQENAQRRLHAMKEKSRHLKGLIDTKDGFLSEFRATEESIAGLPISSISQASKNLIENIDLVEWYALKKRNWNILREDILDSTKYKIMTAGNNQGYPFSFIVLFESREMRDRVRSKLIDTCIYPAILWSIPTGHDAESIEFGNRMLSIHCDGRYETNEIKSLGRTLKKVLDSVC